MHKTDVPLCLRHAREEILLSLDSASAEDSNLHRKLADTYFRKAVHDIAHNPGGEYDWSLLRPHE